MIAARCFIGFLIFNRKSSGKTFKATFDRIIEISLRIYSVVVESLQMAHCAPKCEKTMQALLCRNLNVKPATLLNTTSSRRIRLQNDI
ncbi:hypothetical protein ZWY2020_015083, partial [Hordeum vulgare]